MVELTFEFAVEVGFGWTGTLPIALMDKIGAAKVEIYQALRPNPIQSDMLTAEKIFAVEGRRFRVLCVADAEPIRSDAEVRRLTVFWIDELHGKAA